MAGQYWIPHLFDRQPMLPFRGSVHKPKVQRVPRHLHLQSNVASSFCCFLKGQAAPGGQLSPPIGEASAHTSSLAAQRSCSLLLLLSQPLTLSAHSPPPPLATFMSTFSGSGLSKRSANIVTLGSHRKPCRGMGSEAFKGLFQFKPLMGWILPFLLQAFDFRWTEASMTGSDRSTVSVFLQFSLVSVDFL